MAKDDPKDDHGQKLQDWQTKHAFPKERSTEKPPKGESSSKGGKNK